MKYHIKNPASLIFIPILCLFLPACQGELARELQREPYFDLKGLIDEQISLLDSLNPAVEITAQIDKEKETITIRKDSAAWEAALKLFRDADINQPVLQGNYIVKDSFDSQNGLKVKLYEARNISNASIPYLKVYYQDSLPHVKHIETVFQEENMLYSTQREMSATFDSFHGIPRIIQYNTRGRQKMLFKDSAFYEIQASIEYPS